MTKTLNEQEIFKDLEKRLMKIITNTQEKLTILNQRLKAVQERLSPHVQPLKGGI